MVPGVNAAVMVPSLKFVSTRTAFATSGPGASRSPTSSLLHGPPTPLLRRSPFRFPSRRPTTQPYACSWSATHAYAYAWRVGDFFTGSPSPVFMLWRGRGLPVCRVILCERAVVITPRRVRRHLAHTGGAAVAFRRSGSLGTQVLILFEADTPRPTRSLPYCFARRVTASHAKARYRLVGLNFGRTGIAPVG